MPYLMGTHKKKTDFMFSLMASTHYKNWNVRTLRVRTLQFFYKIGTSPYTRELEPYGGIRCTMSNYQMPFSIISDQEIETSVGYIWVHDTNTLCVLMHSYGRTDYLCVCVCVCVCVRRCMDLSRTPYFKCSVGLICCCVERDSGL